MVFPLAAIGAGFGQFADDYQRQQESALRMMQAQRQMAAFEQEQQQLQRERTAQGAAYRAASQGGFGGFQPQSMPQIGGGSQGWPSGGGPAGGGLAVGGALTKPGGVTLGEAKAAALRAGFDENGANIISAISVPESSLNPYAHNPRYPDDSYGLTQINALAHGPVAKEAWGNVDRAMELAYKVSKGGTNFSPWTTYTSGAYKPYLAEAAKIRAAARPVGLTGDGASAEGSPTDLAAGTGQFAMPTSMAARLGGPQPTEPAPPAAADAVAATGPIPPPPRVTGKGVMPPGGLVTPDDYARYTGTAGSGSSEPGAPAAGDRIPIPPTPPPTDYSRPAPAVAPPPAVPAAAAGPGRERFENPMMQVQQQVLQGVQRTTQITPPSVYGRMGIQGLVQQIEKAMPGADDATKFLALQHAQKLLAPDAQLQLELYREQRQHLWARELQELQDKRSKDLALYQHQLRAGDPTTGWEVLTDKDGTQYRYNKVTGKATTLTGNQPYEPEGAQKLGGGGTGSTSAGAGREAAIAAEVKRLDADWAAANPDATPSQKAAQSFEHRQQAERGIAEAKAAPRADHNIEVRDEASNAVLYRGFATKSPKGFYVKPDGTEVPPGKITGIGTAQPRTEAQMLMGKFLDENPWATAQDAQTWRANRILNEATMRAYGGGILGRNVVALNTVADHVLRVKEYADALGNNQIPRANQLANTIQKERGLPEVTTYEAARTIMADEVVRLLTATGGTRGDREDMQKNFPSMLSPEQFAGVFDMLKGMVGGRLDGLRTGFAHGDPKLEKQFETQFLTPKGREAFLSLTADRAATLPEATTPGATTPGATTPGATTPGATTPARPQRTEPAAAAPPVPESLRGVKLRGWSPSQQKFYDESGNAFDKTGKPVQ